MTKLNFKDLRGKEIFLWSILLLNLTAFLLNIFVGSLFFVILNGAATLWMGYSLNQYYKHER